MFSVVYIKLYQHFNGYDPVVSLLTYMSSVIHLRTICVRGEAIRPNLLGSHPGLECVCHQIKRSASESKADNTVIQFIVSPHLLLCCVSS